MFRSFIAALLALLPWQAAAQSDAPVPEPIDPMAVEIVQSAADFLVESPAFSFRWFVSFDEVVEGREKLTFVESGENLLVRDQGFRSLSERGDTLRNYYYDGARFTVASPNEKFYASAPFEGGLDALIETVRARTETMIPLWSIMSTSLGSRLLDGIEGAAYVGTTHIAGEHVHHLAFAGYDEDWQVWISTDDAAPVPLMLVGTERTKKGWPQYRVYMMDWSFEPEVDPAQFTYTPAEDDLPVSFPALVARDPGGAETRVSAEEAE